MTIYTFQLVAVCKKWKSVALRSWSSTKIIDLKASTWFCKHENFEWNCRDITTSMIHQVLERCENYITQIDLSNKWRLGTDGIIIITELCPKLQSINLHNLLIKESGYRSLIENCNHLKT